MSYKIFFRSTENGCNEEDICRFFAGRKGYKIKGNRAEYRNDNTGVSFMFEFGRQENIGIETNHFSVLLYLNCLRPTFFIREAAIEVGALTQVFSMLADNVSADGLEPELYDEEKFRTKWLEGNQRAVQVFLQKRKLAFTFPQEKLHGLWEWNFYRDEMQAKVTDAVFVPRIMLFYLNNAPATGVVWPDAIPALLPKVDYLLIGRNRLAPKNTSGLVPEPSQNMAVVPQQELETLLQKYSDIPGQDAWCLRYSTPPPEICKLVSALPVFEKKLEGLAYEQVLDREVVHKYVN